ncbi:MAG TPA: CHAT domain-containing protein, partial [Myxococcaceae bacterium]|nr:CHAT domain-containing protein [Myxococcaceae bacterium]
ERHLENALAAARLAGVASFLLGGELPLIMLRHALRGPTPEGLAEAKAVLERGRASHQRYLLMTGARLGARFAAETGNAEAARALADEAVTAAMEAGDPADVPLAHLARAHVEWRAGDRAAFGREAGRAVEAVDQLRWKQPRELARARTSAEWAFAYELLAGWYLDLAGPEPRGSAIEPALATMERLRGRVLLDELVKAGVPRAALSPELASRRTAALGALTQVQLGLVRQPKGAERDELRRKVESAEASLAEVEDEAARNAPQSALVPVATLAELQAALGEDQALLSFQLWRPDISIKAPYPSGASWLVVLTREEAFAVRLPETRLLGPKLAMFRSVLLRGDSSDVAGGMRLREELLGRSLERLPGRVRSLIVVPDGPLHGFPLDALALEDGSPLGARFSVSTVPSASLWLRWRQTARPAAGPALALADPDPTAPPGRDRDASRWLEHLQLPSLPHAREEATALVQALGPGGSLRLGPEASEHFLKTSDLRPWRVIHFATHAVVDETEPERSALALAAGDPQEDGLLQPREIAALDLAGKVIVLSACRTASGELVQGEGTLGLVRAFFRAGALAVIASPWPLDDLETRNLIDELSSRLGRGERLMDALAGAKRARQRAGAPALAWAGLQLHGDGSVAVSSGAVRERPLLRVALLFAGGVLLAMAAWSLRMRRMRSRPRVSGSPSPSVRNSSGRAET